MASRKKTVRKKASVGSPSKSVAPPPSVQGAEAAQGKGMIRVLIAIAVVVCVYLAFSSSHMDFHVKASGPTKFFKVHSLPMIAGDNAASKVFNAWGVAAIGKEKVAVSDIDNNRILIFSRKGKFLKGWGKHGTGPMEFIEPSGMCADNKGNVWVMDPFNGAIKGFNENGKPVGSISLNNKGFFGPRGVAFDGQYFIVADTGNPRVALVNPADGNVIASWGHRGKGSGEFSEFSGIAADNKGNYFVADGANNRLQWLNKNGEVLKIIKFDSNVGTAAVDKEGRFYVSLGSIVKAYSPTGDYLGDLRDENGSAPNISVVQGMTVSEDDVLIMTSRSGIAMSQLPAVGAP